TGQVFVYFGGANGISSLARPVTVTGSGPGAEFGSSVASAGDINGDGHADVIVGACGGCVNQTAPAGGHADIYGASGSVEGAMLLWSSAEEGIWANGPTYYGLAVAGVGDVNGDGYSDFAVASNIDASTNAHGQVYLHLGGSANLGRSTTAVAYVGHSNYN